MDEREVERAFAAGAPVAAWIGDDHLPVGDFGHRKTDARLLLTVLAANGRAAEFLRAAVARRHEPLIRIVVAQRPITGSSGPELFVQLAPASATNEK